MGVFVNKGKRVGVTVAGVVGLAEAVAMGVGLAVGVTVGLGVLVAFIAVGFGVEVLFPMVINTLTGAPQAPAVFWARTLRVKLPFPGGFQFSWVM